MSDAMSIDDNVVGGPADRGPQTCYTCHHVGHKQARCPNRGSNANQNGNGNRNRNNNNGNNANGNNNQRGGRRNSQQSNGPVPRQNQNQRANNNQSQNQNQPRNQRANNNNFNQQQSNSGFNQQQNRQQLNNSSNDGALHCDQHPNSKNHTTENCSKNKNSNNNDRSQATSNAHFQPAASGYAKHGYTYKDRLPTYSGSAPYCLACNKNDHFQSRCPCPENASRLINSHQVCWKCCLRGHIGDECLNPEQEACGTCHKSGHKTEQCTNSFGAALRAENPKERFKWEPQANWTEADFPPGMVDRYRLQRNVEEAALAGFDLDNAQFMAESERIQAMEYDYFPTVTQRKPPSARTCKISAWLRSTGSSSSSSFATGGSSRRPSAASGPLSHQHGLTAQQRAVRAHIERSTTLYCKHNVRGYLKQKEQLIRKYEVIPDSTFVLVEHEMSKGTQFWRDPAAMKALSRQHTPVCHNCHSQGQILDRNFHNIVFGEGEDVTKVQDWDDWGLFVMFRCGCCHDGFGYQDVSAYHNVDMQE